MNNRYAVADIRVIRTRVFMVLFDSLISCRTVCYERLITKNKGL